MSAHRNVHLRTVGGVGGFSLSGGGDGFYLSLNGLDFICNKLDRL